MSNVNALLGERLKKSGQTSKMAAVAKQSAEGNLTSFSGIFSVSELSGADKESLAILLKEYASTDEDLSGDLNALISITSEVKAINNQAAILHGERIKKAHEILIKYQDGAFTAWLIATYGNRQTPYNFLQYYEFYEALPRSLRPQIEAMPRQAVYTLASRDGPLASKQRIVENFSGQTKAELLLQIRETFPLPVKDKRRPDFAQSAIQILQKLYHGLDSSEASITNQQKKTICQLLIDLRNLINKG